MKLFYTYETAFIIETKIINTFLIRLAFFVRRSSANPFPSVADQTSSFRQGYESRHRDRTTSMGLQNHKSKSDQPHTNTITFKLYITHRD